MATDELILIIVTLAAVLYVGLIRPKLQHSQAVKENREWLFGKMGISESSLGKSDASQTCSFWRSSDYRYPRILGLSTKAEPNNGRNLPQE